MGVKQQKNKQKEKHTTLKLRCEVRLREGARSMWRRLHGVLPVAGSCVRAVGSSQLGARLLLCVGSLLGAGCRSWLRAVFYAAFSPLHF